MTLTIDKKEKILIRLFLALFSVFMAGLFVSAFFFSWQNREYNIEYTYKAADNVLINVLGIALSLGLAWAAGSAAQKFLSQKKMEVLAVITGVICVVIGAFWVYVTRTAPQADQGAIANLAAAFENGDVSSLLRGGYASNHRQQLGLITFVRILYKVFGVGNYKAYQYFTAVSLWLLVYSGYRVVRLLTEDDIKVQTFYLVMMLLCVPMYGYAPYVYGDLSSTAFVMLAAWVFLSALKKFAWWKPVVLAACGGVMTQLRRNTLIIAMGFAIVIVLKLIGTCQMAKWKVLLTGISLWVGILAAQFMVSAMYAPYIPEDAKETPSILFVVMGLHDSIEDQPGWYDFANEIIYMENDYDPVAATAVAKQEIGIFKEKCIASPGYALKFFVQKTNTQWNAPMYQCIVMNNHFYEEPKGLAAEIYFNGKSAYLESFMNIYQLVVYGGILVLVVFLLIGKKEMLSENYMILIGIYGGFLFSLIWEAKTRYVFPYFLIMIPYAAVGIWEVLKLLQKARTKKS